MRGDQSLQHASPGSSPKALSPPDSCWFAGWALLDILGRGIIYGLLFPPTWISLACLVVAASMGLARASLPAR